MNITPQMTFIEFKSIKFVLASQPNSINISSYIKELLQYNTHAIVKVCESNYNVATFSMMGITVKELIFADGTFPSSAIIDKWIEFVANYFDNYRDSALAVHCQSGLGRSAVLIAIAFIECGLEKPRVIDIIRKIYLLMCTEPTH
ncbi:hypothetical protein RN001_016087 [Aquatica leii]|uniref:Tyrosine specific protein phosphatases domain-containing protein n=1 Tax=Aquatica leii TaxID=1421715 RepID=A0AAN7SK92_9COLE|nr:hypothetical protein RN001_016087 [Aquatica leii]